MFDYRNNDIIAYNYVSD